MISINTIPYQKYSRKEILALIASGYVPVGSGAELNALRTTTTQKMGAGTIYEGNYATGVDKKYIQVRNITLIDYQAGTGWTPILPTGIIFNGNNLQIKDLKITNSGVDNMALFGGANSYGTFSNIRISNADVTGKNFVGTLLSRCINSNIDNVIVDNSKVSGNANFSLFIGAYDGGTNSESYIIKNIYIKNSEATAQNTITNVFMGGMFGYIFYATGFTHKLFVETSKVENCKIVCKGQYVGGIVGLSQPSLAGATVDFINCKSIRNNITNTTAYLGGLIGYNVGVGSVVTNCLSTSKITAPISTAFVGGLIGRNTGTITNSPYDSQTSGQSDANGLPRTTLQMVNGTPNSFILANGEIDPDSLAGNAMYTAWDESIWRFHNNKYPKIKRI